MIEISPHNIPSSGNRRLAALIHYVAKAGFVFCRLFSRNSAVRKDDLSVEKIKKVLVIRMDQLGDIAMSTPAFSALSAISIASLILSESTATWTIGPSVSGVMFSI